MYKNIAYKLHKKRSGSFRFFFLFHTSDKVYKELGFNRVASLLHEHEGLVFMLVFENY